jgi:putative DNA primase/helicase
MNDIVNSLSTGNHRGIPPTGIPPDPSQTPQDRHELDKLISALWFFDANERWILNPSDIPLHGVLAALAGLIRDGQDEDEITAIWLDWSHGCDAWLLEADQANADRATCEQALRDEITTPTHPDITLDQLYAAVAKHGWTPPEPRPPTKPYFRKNGAFVMDDGFVLASTWPRKNGSAAGSTPDNPAPPNGQDQNGQGQPASDTAGTSQDGVINKLARLDAIAYGRARKAVAKELGVGVAAVDAAVERKRAEMRSERDKEAGEAPLYPHWIVEPWPEEVDGDALIRDIASRMQSHVIMPQNYAVVVALWIMLTWAHEAATHSPTLMITSPEAACGKSTLLDLVALLLRRALPTVSITGPALFRSIEKWKPTLLIDEADTIFAENEELRAVLNSGWTRGQGVVRCAGDDNEPALFATFCPKVLALKGKRVPDTVATRAIVIELKRKLDHETTADFKHQDDEGLRSLRQQLARWSTDNIKELANASPALPAGFANRVAANWKPLLAIADACGMGELAREAAVEVAALKASDDESAGLELLSDVRDVFDDKDRPFTADDNKDCILSKRLVELLVSDEELRWSTFNAGKPISQKQVSRRLRGYQILSKVIWIGEDRATRKSGRGFERQQFEEVWERYLPPIFPPGGDDSGEP